uniref:G-protein coupled receptors family 1 profile domain-containing protein n=1 Tax=Takifugu rubripes TaxID=31033 RepID=A0A674NGW9_TAKRU
MFSCEITTWLLPDYFFLSLSPELLMENLTMLTPLKNPVVFELVGFYVPPGSGPLFFCMALIAYLLTLLANGVVAGVILIDKSLHRPMFIMICHLVVCNVLGATTMLPCLMLCRFSVPTGMSLCVTRSGTPPS